MADKVVTQGGAKIEERVVKPVVPDVEPADDVIGVITTAPGTLGPEGIVPPGTKARIKIGAFSKAWMQPATKADAEKLEAAKKGA